MIKNSGLGLQDFYLDGKNIGHLRSISVYCSFERKWMVERYEAYGPDIFQSKTFMVENYSSARSAYAAAKNWLTSILAERA